MLNRLTKDNVDNGFYFAQLIVKNIDFALISLKFLLSTNKFKKNTYYLDECTYYFFYLQNLLTACGNIANVFYNNFARKRSTELREKFKVSKEEFKLIFQKEVRNTNEHFDERYDSFGSNQIGDYNIVEKNTPQNIKDILLNSSCPHLRTFDCETKIYYTYDRHFELIKYDLCELNRQLSKMRDRITNNGLFSEGWMISR